jgi:D-glycero-D-manno-heptose 1,7-bisphosphate phosphatase
MTTGGRRAVLLDRDGTILEDVGYPFDPAQVRLLPGAAEALVWLAAQGCLLVVVSNQSGVGRGLITPDQARAVHQRFVALLADSGVALAASYYCFHAPEEVCDCRKPLPGLLQSAFRDLRLDPRRCVMVGDKDSDVEAGLSAGCTTVWLSQGRRYPLGSPSPHFEAPSLLDAVDVFRRLSAKE